MALCKVHTFTEKYVARLVHLSWAKACYFYSHFLESSPSPSPSLSQWRRCRSIFFLCSNSQQCWVNAKTKPRNPSNRVYGVKWKKNFVRRQYGKSECMICKATFPRQSRKTHSMIDKSLKWKRQNWNKNVVTWFSNGFLEFIAKLLKAPKNKLPKSIDKGNNPRTDLCTQTQTHWHQCDVWNLEYGNVTSRSEKKKKCRKMGKNESFHI